MQITTIAGITLASNGWEIVADPMLAGNAGDNWSPQTAAITRNYPIMNRITIEQRATTRILCATRIAAMLEALENTSEELWWCYLGIVHDNTAYYVYINPIDITVSPLQTTGSLYIQRLTITFQQLFPPVAANESTLTVNNQFGYSSFSLVFPGSNITWMPARFAATTTATVEWVGIFISDFAIFVKSWPATSGWTTITYNARTVLHNNSGTSQFISATLSGDVGTRNYYAIISLPAAAAPVTATVTTPYGTYVLQVTPQQHIYFLFSGYNVPSFTISGTFPHDTYLYPVLSLATSEQSHMYVSPIGEYANPQVALTHPTLAVTSPGCLLRTATTITPMTPNVYFYTRRIASYMIAFSQRPFLTSTVWSVTGVGRPSLLGVL